MDFFEISILNFSTSKMRCFTKLRSCKLKLLVLTATIIILLWLYAYSWYTIVEILFVSKSSSGINRTTAKRPIIVLPNIVVHFDLKGTPVKLSYLESLLPKLRDLGANGLLMEYEDMFPYEGRLVNLSAERRYEKKELTQFLVKAKGLGFQVIPLVQTYGHMEHALKLKEFQHLREDFLHPDSICPSQLESLTLVQEMIHQVMKFHMAISPLKFMHIGCDEVYHLNECVHCVNRNISNAKIFLHHVSTISGFVKSLSPNTAVLIWDDMLREIEVHEFYQMAHLPDVQLVYWDYSPYLGSPIATFHKYHEKFPHIWIASAYKGADGRTSMLPNLRNRFFNVLSWMELIQNFKFAEEVDVYNFRGIILTGWSRYTHMDPPCDLLPVAYPSLIISLLLVHKFISGNVTSLKDLRTGTYYSIYDDFLNENVNFGSHMDCKMGLDSLNKGDCIFDGVRLHVALSEYFDVLQDYTDGTLVNDDTGLEYLEYYANIGAVDTNKIPKTKEFILSKMKTLVELENVIKVEMEKYYEKDFINEYVNYKTYNHKNKLRSALNALNDYSKVRSWPRRMDNVSYYIYEDPCYKI